MAGNPDRRRELLVQELEQVVGAEAVDGASLDVDRAMERRRPSIGAAFESSSLLLVVVGAALVVVGVIASLALESWLFFALAIAAHALFTVVVVGSAFALTAGAEKPAPTTEAALQEAGVRDPSGALDDLVGQVEESDGTRDAHPPSL
jgi:hypothetical protein